MWPLSRRCTDARDQWPCLCSSVEVFYEIERGGVIVRESLVLRQRGWRRRQLPAEHWLGPPGVRPRVVLECPAHASPYIVAEALTRAGFEVVPCEGPGPYTSCPVVAGERCSAIEGADVIVNLLGVAESECVEVLRGVQQRHADVPVVIEVPAPRAAQNADLLQGCRVAYAPVGSASLVKEIWSALDGAQDDRP